MPLRLRADCQWFKTWVAMTDGSDGGFDPNTLTEFVAIWLPRVFLLSFGLLQKSLFAKCFYLFFFESLSLNTQEGLHQKGKSKGDILQSILFFARQSAKGGAKGKDWGGKGKGQGESSSLGCHHRHLVMGLESHHRRHHPQKKLVLEGKVCRSLSLRRAESLKRWGV